MMVKSVKLDAKKGSRYPATSQGVRREYFLAGQYRVHLRHYPIALLIKSLHPRTAILAAVQMEPRSDMDLLACSPAMTDLNWKGHIQFVQMEFLVNHPCHANPKRV